MRCHKLLLILALGGLLPLSPGFAQNRVPPPDSARGNPLKPIDKAIRLREYARAARQLAPLARQGIAEAEYRLAGLYRAGRGVKRDPEKALDLYRRAAGSGLADAQYALALLLMKRPEAEAQAEARHWLQAAADQGLSRAARQLKKLGSISAPAATSDKAADLKRLFSLVRGNELAELKKLQRHGADLSRLDDQGNSPLIVALRSGHRELSQWLLNHDQHATTAGAPGERALLIAARQDYADIVDALLRRGIDPNGQDDAGNTALHVATRHQNTTIMKQLLDKGADPRKKNRKGQSPLQLAQNLGLKKSARLFKARGLALPRQDRQLAAPDIKAFEKSIKGKKSLYRGWPILNIASLLGETRILKQLLEQGADINATDPDGNSALHRAASKGQLKTARILRQNGIDLDRQNRKGETALYLAALNGHKAFVSWLLKQGADSRLATRKGSTPLLAAIRSGNPAIADLLADRPLGDKHLHQALLEAIQRRMEALSLRLLPRDRLAPLKDKQGRSLLWMAADKGLNRLAAALIRKHPADIDQADKSGYTPLARAVYRGYLNMAGQLIDSQARLDLLTRDGNSLPMLAVLSGQPKMLEKLLGYPNDINQRNAHGDTALMLAAAAGNKPMVRLLIDAGADLQMRNKSNLTAEQLARQAGHDQVADLIRQNKGGLFRIFE
jgi:ankyrin repeat protein